MAGLAGRGSATCSHTGGTPASRKGLSQGVQGQARLVLTQLPVEHLWFATTILPALLRV